MSNKLLLVGIEHESQEPSDMFNASEVVDAAEEDEDDAQIPNESRISKALSEAIQKIVVMICLILLFILPLTQIETYIPVYLFHEQGLDIAVGIYNDGQSWPAYQQAIDELTKGADHTTYYPLLWLNVPDPSIGSAPFNSDLVDLFPNKDELDSDLKNYRRDAYASKLKISDNGLEFVAVYDIRSSNVLESIINIARTLFVTVVLAVASAHFGNQTNRLVLGPIERMLEKVRLIATNPLAAASDQVEMAGALSMAHQL